MAITLKDLEYLAKLSKLELSEAEKPLFAQEINAILASMEEFQQLDAAQIPPAIHILPLENVFREDNCRPCLSREEALSNAPEHTDEYFRVPRIL